MILPINSPAANLENAGGKGANLSKLFRAGFPVPDGFIITTDAYLEFVNANNLGEKIQGNIAKITPQDSSVLEQISKEIRTSFREGTIPNQIKNRVEEAYAQFIGKPVAVRSSATAEDLPDLSFAGQQDTFLNVVNLEALFAALVDCWSSLCHMEKTEIVKYEYSYKIVILFILKRKIYYASQICFVGCRVQNE